MKPPDAIPTLTTSHLVLRPFTFEDVLPLHRILNQDDILKYFPNPDPPPLERVGRFVERQLAHWAEHNYGWWAVVPAGHGELIGWNGLQFLPETGETEVGFLLSKPFWGQGFATEGARASLQFGFDNFDLERIIGLVHPENVASQRVLTKIGMSFIDRAAYFGMDLFRYWIDRKDFTHENV